MSSRLLPAYLLKVPPWRQGWVLVKMTFDPQLLAGRYLKIRSQRGLDDVYELLGRNLGGDYLHVIYHVLTDGRFRVFHISRMSESQRRRYQRYQR